MNAFVDIESSHMAKKNYKQIAITFVCLYGVITNTDVILLQNFVDLDERKMEMVGNVVSGTLSGTWTDVKIVNGNLSLNQKFPKYSK